MLYITDVLSYSKTSPMTDALGAIKAPAAISGYCYRIKGYLALNDQIEINYLTKIPCQINSLLVDDEKKYL